MNDLVRWQNTHKLTAEKAADALAISVASLYSKRSGRRATTRRDLKMMANYPGQHHD